LTVRISFERVTTAKGADVCLAIATNELDGRKAFMGRAFKVVVCSGYTIEGPPQEILDAGAEGFVQKPFHIATLAEKLKEVLEGK